jgi:hypothetical protein
MPDPPKLVGRDLLLPVRDRWKNPAAGPMDDRPGQAMVAN